MVDLSASVMNRGIFIPYYLASRGNQGLKGIKINIYIYIYIYITIFLPQF